MLPFRRILLPVDYSDAGTAIMLFAKDAISHFSADVTLVHAYGPEALGYVDLPITNPEIADQAARFEQERLQDFAKQNFPGQRVECITALGEPSSVVLEVVRSQGTDLVMLPTHGRGPLRRMLLGSVTAKILHDVSSAVWTGAGEAFEGHRPRVPYQHILCAVDGGEESEAVMVATAALAKSYAAACTILQAIDLPRGSFEADYVGLLQDIQKAADQNLRETKAKLGIDAPHRVRHGLIAPTVRATALDVKADLIVTGRGRSQRAISRMWSNLYEIVREAPCPVLSI